MKKSTIVTFEESDYEILGNLLPDKPCEECHKPYACCGCDREREYKQKIATYKEADVYEIALILKQLTNLSCLIKTSEAQMKSLLEELHATGIDTSKLQLLNIITNKQEKTDSMQIF